MYIRKSVQRAAGNPGIGIQLRDQLVLLNVDDIAYMPAPDDKGVVIVDNIVMRPGRYGICLYMTPGTAEITSAAEGDTDQIGFTPAIKFNHPGNNQEVREFKVNELNSKFIGIMRYCNGKPADLIGTLCNPCTITPSYTGNKDGNTNEFTLQQISKGNDLFIYKGTIPLEEPVTTVTAAATSVTFSADGQYQLSAGEAAIASITGGSDGSLITLLGCEGTSPTVAPVTGKIVLKAGKTFTATAGSQLTLRAFNAGGENLMWIEQSRYVPA